MTYDDTDTFALFTNNKREKENSPNLTGKINVGGKELRLAAWVKKNDDGSLKVISGKVSEFQQPNQATSAQSSPGGQQEAPQSEQPGNFDNFDDDIPF